MNIAAAVRALIGSSHPAIIIAAAACAVMVDAPNVGVTSMTRRVCLGMSLFTSLVAFFRRASSAQSGRLFAWSPRTTDRLRSICVSNMCCTGTAGRTLASGLGLGAGFVARVVTGRGSGAFGDCLCRNLARSLGEKPPNIPNLSSSGLTRRASSRHGMRTGQRSQKDRAIAK